MKRLLLQSGNLAKITWLELLWSFRMPEGVAFHFLSPAIVLVLLGLVRGGRGYLHILVPGLITMTIASNAMQGVGTKMSFMRAHGNWRTLRASPIPVGLYFTGLVCSRLMRIILIVCFMLLVAYLLLGYRPQGSVALTLLYISVGTFVFAALGLVVAFLVPSPQAVSGTMSMILLPMVLIGDVLFVSRVEWVQTVSLFSPLTYLVRLMRENLGGAGAGEDWLTNLGMLGVWLVLCCWAAAGMAKWRVEER